MFISDHIVILNYFNKQQRREFWWRIVTRIITWNSDVVRICLESGDQWACNRPADPSSILHFHSGLSIENTWIILRLFKEQRINSESGDHWCLKRERENWRIYLVVKKKHY